MASVKEVSVIDYGVGNLYSVAGALERCGAQVKFVSTAAEIKSASQLVLPGVGAFANGMQELRNRNLVAAIQEYCHEGKPLLGICLGMQMLFDESEEFGTHQGLGLIPGRVVKIPQTTLEGKPHKIPHIGWSDLLTPKGQKTFERTSVLTDTAPGSAVYFVHSFMAMPANQENRIADCDYNGRKISATVSHKNIIGCQFHLEKSGPIGLQILSEFLKKERQRN